MFGKEKKEVKKVKVLGVRTAEQTVITTWNFSHILILIEYADGSREIKECSAKEMKDYMYFIPMD